MTQKEYDTWKIKMALASKIVSQINEAKRKIRHHFNESSNMTFTQKTREWHASQSHKWNASLSELNKRFADL